MAVAAEFGGVGVAVAAGDADFFNDGLHRTFSILVLGDGVRQR
jgi:hypothetical protein